MKLAGFTLIFVAAGDERLAGPRLFNSRRFICDERKLASLLSAVSTQCRQHHLAVEDVRFGHARLVDRDAELRTKIA